MADQLNRARLLEELRTLLVNDAPGLDGHLSVDASLIVSGLVESSTLVSLAVWVEGCIGREMDLGALDLTTEWDSINAILNFVERHAGDTVRDGN